MQYDKPSLPQIILVRSQAIHSDILDWMILLHQRVPRCTVLLVASHSDQLERPENENGLLQLVEDRVKALHEQWQEKRQRLKHSDGRMTVLPGVMAVSCTKECVRNGISVVVERLVKFVDTLYIPPSWSLARTALEEVAQGAAEPVAGGACRVSVRTGGQQPWVTRQHVYDTFRNRVRSLNVHHPMHGLLDDENIKEAMDGALDTRWGSILRAR